MEANAIVLMIVIFIFLVTTCSWISMSWFSSLETFSDAPIQPNSPSDTQPSAQVQPNIPEPEVKHVPW